MGRDGKPVLNRSGLGPEPTARRARHGVRVATVIGLAIAMPGAASAQPRRAQAIQHFERGEAHFKAGAYDKSIAEFHVAYELVPKRGLLFNIGLAYEKMGDAEHALAFYRRYLAAAPREAKAAEARARSEALVRQLAAQRESAARAEADRWRAGVARWVREAFEDWATDPPGYAAQPPPERPLGPVDRAERRSLVPGLVVLGGAAALAGAGVAYGARAGRIRGELSSELLTGTPPLDSQDPRFDEGKQAARLSALFYGLAGAAAATGTALTARALWGAPRAGELSIRTAVGPGEAGVGLEMSW